MGKLNQKNDHNTPMDDEWNEALNKLRDSRHLMSIEDEERIIDVVKRLI